MTSSNSTRGNSSNSTSPSFEWIVILLPAIAGTTLSIVAVASCHFLSVPFLPSRMTNLGFFRADNGSGCSAYTLLDELLADSTPPMLRAARAFGVIAAILSGMALLALFPVVLLKKTTKTSTRRALRCLSTISAAYIVAFVSQLLALLFFVRSVEVSCGGGSECVVYLTSGAAFAVVAAVLFLLLGVFLFTCGPLPDESAIIGHGKSQRQQAVGPDQKKAKESRPGESAPTDDSKDASAAECIV